MNFLQFFSDATITAAINAVVQSTRELAINKMLPLFLSFAILKAIWSHWTDNNKWGIEIKELVRIGLLMFFLFFFLGVMSALDGAVRLSSNFLPPTHETSGLICSIC